MTSFLTARSLRHHFVSARARRVLRGVPGGGASELLQMSMVA